MKKTLALTIALLFNQNSFANNQQIIQPSTTYPIINNEFAIKGISINSAQIQYDPAVYTTLGKVTGKIGQFSFNKQTIFSDINFDIDTRKNSKNLVDFEVKLQFLPNNDFFGRFTQILTDIAGNKYKSSGIYLNASMNDMSAKLNKIALENFINNLFNSNDDVDLEQYIEQQLAFLKQMAEEKTELKINLKLASNSGDAIMDMKFHLDKNNFAIAEKELRNAKSKQEFDASTFKAGKASAEIKIGQDLVDLTNLSAVVQQLPFKPVFKDKQYIINITLDGRNLSVNGVSLAKI